MSRTREVAVADAGPLIHLSEISAVAAFDVFTEVRIPLEVERETRMRFNKIRNVKIRTLQASAKDLTKIVASRYGIDMGEAAAIALAVQEKITLFLTDDLSARDVAKIYDLEPHGTLGILLRAFREGFFSKEEALNKVRLLYEGSTLFVTKDLISWISKQIEGYNP
ncbi:hypothetical protein HYU18_01390 [Candidatus Woesearchaeota archaeon]|nr:hypothetical protein [Candidatus Woesearchaeota archaeon]